MNKDIGNLPSHDALLLGVIIDRSNPGHVDTIELSIEWDDGKKSFALFRDCYAMRSKMNFGIVALESIRSVEISDQSDDLDAIKEAYNCVGAGIPTLKCFTLETNSTASIIKVFALSLEISPAN